MAKFKICIVLSILAVGLVLSPRITQAQDPETIGAVANVISKYLNQSADDQRWERLGDRLSDIERRLGVIEQQLRDISDRIFQLQRIVQEQPQIEARNNVLSDIEVMEDHFRDWLQQGRRRAREGAYPVLLALQKDTNNLMLRSSWSNFQVVALGMVAERDLLIISGEGKAARYARFERYRKYFADAQDVGIVGSIGQRWRTFHDEASDLQAKNLTVPPGATCFIGKLWSSRGLRTTCKYNLNQKLIGSIRDGWCYGEPVLSNENSCYTTPGDTRGDRPDRPDRNRFMAQNRFAAAGALGAQAEGGESEPPPFDTSGFISGPIAGPQPLPGCRQRSAVQEFAPSGQVIDGVPNVWCPDVLNNYREKFTEDAKAADVLFIALQVAKRFEKQAESLREQYR